MGYIKLDKDFLEKNKEKAEEFSMNENGEEGKGSYLFLDSDFAMNESVTIEEINDKGNITFSVTNNLGYFSFDVPLDDDDLIQIMQIVTKRLNKFKTVMESLK